MPIAFIGIYLFSKLDNSARARREQTLFEQQYVRAETGIGASTAEAY